MKRLPIFLNNDPEEGQPVYFILDLDYALNSETASRELVQKYYNSSRRH